MKSTTTSTYFGLYNPVKVFSKIYNAFYCSRKREAHPPEDPLPDDGRGLDQQWFAAVKAGDTEALKDMLERGVDPNVKDKHGWAAVHLAAWNGSASMCAVLLTTPGLLVDLPGGPGSSTALSLACQCGHEALVKLLLATNTTPQQHRSPPQSSPSSVVVCEVNSTSAQQQHSPSSQQSAAPSAQQQHSPSSHHHHHHHPSTPAANPRLAPPPMTPTAVICDVNHESTLGEHGRVTPLHLAAQNGRAAVCRLLLAAGADANAAMEMRTRHPGGGGGYSVTGVTPLHLAVQADHVDVMDVLLEAGADVQSSTGPTAKPASTVDNTETTC